MCKKSLCRSPEAATKWRWCLRWCRQAGTSSEWHRWRKTAWPSCSCWGITMYILTQINRHRLTHKPWLLSIAGIVFIKQLFEINGASARQHANLKHTVVVHLHQWESKALCQHPVDPPFHDGRNTEPVQRELWEQRHTRFSSVRIKSPLLIAASSLWPLTWKMMSSAAFTLLCSATMSSLRRPSSQASMVSSPYWNSWVFLHSPQEKENLELETKNVKSIGEVCT